MSYSRTRLALLQRAERAVMRLYHLATPTWPADFGPYAADFDQWLGHEGADALNELNRPYLASSPGLTASERFRDPMTARVARRLACERARREAEAYPAARVVELFGELYTWGRGGRTVAPDRLVQGRGGSSFALSASYLDGWSAERLTEAVRVLEAFGAEVAAWNAAVPERWADYTAEMVAADASRARAILARSRAGIRALLADWRRVRALGLDSICATVRGSILRQRAAMREAFATLDGLRPYLTAGEA